MMVDSTEGSGRLQARARDVVDNRIVELRVADIWTMIRLRKKLHVERLLKRARIITKCAATRVVTLNQSVFRMISPNLATAFNHGWRCEHILHARITKLFGLKTNILNGRRNSGS